MKKFIITLYSVELLAALRLGTFGEWWAARAARRLRKFSGDLSDDQR